jgi:hypothetical protein
VSRAVNKINLSIDLVNMELVDIGLSIIRGLDIQRLGLVSFKVHNSQ